MQYRADKHGHALSALGYGCMRFTKKGGSIDLAKAEREVAAAISGGVNYLDTAYVYPGNEAAVGEIVRRLCCRGRVRIATKLPHYLIKSVSGAERLFQEELRRLQTDYIDYYLMHMLTDTATWEKLCRIGIDRWIGEKLRTGQIRNIGFSYHGSSEMFCALADAYDWDFCQIQYNYMDEHAQAGRTGLRYAHGRGLPVIIMEPLRGGRLVSALPKEAQRLLSDSGTTAAALALRWLYDQEEVTCVLSGMNSLAMVEENVKTADTSPAGCLTEGERELIRRIREEIGRTTQVGCTGCGYCMPCPAGVDIPGTFQCYNAAYTEGKAAARKDYLRCTAMRQGAAGASRCVGCGRCEERCPQRIAVRQELRRAAAVLETPGYKAARWGIQKLKLW